MSPQAVTRTRTAAKPQQAATVSKPKVERVRVITPVGRIVYPYLIEPDEGREYSDNKWKLDILFPKETWEEQGRDLRLGVLKVAREFYKNPKLKLSEFKHPFKDGDTKEQDFYHNHIVMTPKSQFQPTVVGPDKATWSEVKVGTIKGGDYGRCVLSIFPYTQKKGGVTTGLEVFQFAQEGEALTGGRSVAISMLDEIQASLSDLDESEMPVDEEETGAEGSESYEGDEEEIDDDNVIL